MSNVKKHPKFACNVLALIFSSFCTQFKSFNLPLAIVGEPFTTQHTLQGFQNWFCFSHSPSGYVFIAVYMERLHVAKTQKIKYIFLPPGIIL